MELVEPIAINTKLKNKKDLKESLQILQTWFSPSFPVGSFSYSHGLEAMIIDNLIKYKKADYEKDTFDEIQKNNGILKEAGCAGVKQATDAFMDGQLRGEFKEPYDRLTLAFCGDVANGFSTLAAAVYSAAR